MTTKRLFRRPKHTEDVLGEITSGASTTDEVAEGLGNSRKTAMNKIHDGVILGLVNREDGHLSVTEDSRRVVQLQDLTPLREAFEELPGVSKLLNQIQDDSMTFEEAGRLISFETKSGAAAEDTFRSYGSVYAHWISYLDLGTRSDGVLASSPEQVSVETEPLENPRGANCPRVAPEKVFELLPRISRADSREDLEASTEMSTKTVEKTLSTCYALGIADYTRTGPVVTDRGRELQQSSIGNRKSILAEELLQIPLVQAFCEEAPDGGFSAETVMNRVSETHLKGWSEVTVQTRANRLVPWLTYTEIAEDETQGELVLSAELDNQAATP
ncbi:AAA-associated domain-containing protein [Halosimplex sp. J119]